MSEEVKRGRGRPRKNTTSNVIVETNTEQSSPTTESNYEFNSYLGTVPMSELDTIFGCSISTAFTPEEIKLIIKVEGSGFEYFIKRLRYLFIDI